MPIVNCCCGPCCEFPEEISLTGYAYAGYDFQYEDSTYVKVSFQNIPDLAAYIALNPESPFADTCELGSSLTPSITIIKYYFDGVIGEGVNPDQTNQIVFVEVCSCPDSFCVNGVIYHGSQAFFADESYNPLAPITFDDNSLTEQYPGCCITCCCCLPPVVIQANSSASGGGTWDVEYTYQSTTCLEVCGQIVSFHTYHHTAGTLPGYLMGIENITLGHWCGIPASDCMEDFGIPLWIYPTPFGVNTSPLVGGIVNSIETMITSTPLDALNIQCSCNVLIDGDMVQWRWDIATNTDHLTEAYKSQCPIIVYSYRMTPCNDGIAYDGFTNVSLAEGSVWFDGMNCYTATAQEYVEGSVPICDLTEVTDCESPECSNDCICEPVDGLYQYTLARCIDYPVEDFYTFLPDCYADGTVLREAGTEFPRYILTCGPTTGMQTLVTFTVPEITVCP